MNIHFIAAILIFVVIFLLTRSPMPISAPPPGPEPPPGPFSFTDFIIKKVPGDHHCFYHALLLHMFPSEYNFELEYVRQLREHTGLCIFKKWDILTTDHNKHIWKAALARIAGNGWAHDSEIAALSMCLEIVFHIYQEGHYAPEDSWAKGVWIDPTWSKVDHRQYPDDEPKDTIYLYNTNNTHYDLMVKKK